jgi:translation initiation factor IF-2
MRDKHTGLRVHELAKQLGISSKELLGKLKGLKVEAKSHLSIIDEETAQIIKHELSSRPEELEVEREVEVKPAGALKEIEVKIPMTVKDLAGRLSLKPSQLIKRMMELKILATINQPLEQELIQRIAGEFGYSIKPQPTAEELIVKFHQEQRESGQLSLRAPVVTLMGHVDHGKTSLLDAIRESRITERESGGITQHIGAYEVFLPKGKVVFLDTPGHEAFTAMRARGTSATDIVILVVAADDGVMPQTIEAIDHAKAAQTPIVVAINKIDKPSANPDRVKQQLSGLGLAPEDWGGKTIMVPVSAKTREGIDQLLEMILLEAEMLELKANYTGPASGVVIESWLSKGGGPQATVLIQNGTLKVGDLVLVGANFGKIRAMINDRGLRLKEAGPSTPVEILGLSGLPQAGELFYTVEDEKTAKDIATKRAIRQKEAGLAKMPSGKITLQELYEQVKEGKLKELKLILKADVQGSLEALADSLKKLDIKEVNLNIIHSGIGDITESDIMLASASCAIVIGFHVGFGPNAKEASRDQSVEVRLYRVIYEAINEIKASLEGLLEPKEKRIFLGRALIKQVFKLSKAGMIAGCIVQKGKIHRNSNIRILRDEDVVYEGKVSSLKRFKDDVREVSEGFECGIGIAGFEDIKAGDIIEAFEIERIARKLE